MSDTPQADLPGDLPVADKTAERARRNTLSAAFMLGHLCALYDGGVWEAGRLMSNLLFQLALRRPRNTPLLAQIGLHDSLRVMVDKRARGTVTTESSMSPLVGVAFGVNVRGPGGPRPAAVWVPLPLAPDARPEFDGLPIDA